MRKLSPRITAVVVILGLAALIGGTVSASFAENLSKPPPAKKYHPKMQSVLGELVEKYNVGGTPLAQSFAEKRGISLENSMVTVIVEPPLGEKASAVDQEQLLSYGASVEARSQHLLRVKVLLSSLQQVAEKVSGVRYIRLPAVPLPLVTSEGVDLTGAPNYHDAGYQGENTNVAIIDLGFIGLSSAQSAGELPATVITQDYTGSGMESGTNHGTAVAEIVHDMAPSADLYLVNVGDEVDLENAKDWCISQGVDIVNHSVGWVNFNFTDGAGTICNITNDARSNGILWVNAAGNSAHRHYQEFFTDNDTDGWHNYTSNDEGNTFTHSGGTIAVFLTWDRWPTTDQDYDLYLYDADTGTIVDYSANLQTGDQPPTEAIYGTFSAGNYFIAVDQYDADLANELKIFTFYHDLEHQTPQHSLMSPADATGVMSVAAIDQANWATGPQEAFSSQGPTNDGRTKPDITGPDRVSTFTYGTTGFPGTSASSPHGAGAASLVLSRYPGYTADDLQSYLENNAVDIGTTGKDNIYGSGKLFLPTPDFVDITGIDPTAFPKIYTNVFVDTPTGLAGDLTADDFTIFEDGVEQTIESFSFVSEGLVADIVFTFDDTASMWDEIDAMKAEAASLATAIVDAGVDARFGLVSFKDEPETDLSLTSDVDAFVSAVNSLSASGGGDTPEDNLDAIVDYAGAMSFREGAQKILIDITDAPTHYRGDGSGFSNYTMSEVISGIKEEGVTVFVVSPDFGGLYTDEEDKKYLAQETGGMWIDIDAEDFSNILNEIVEIITAQYTIDYTTTNPAADGTERLVEVQVSDPDMGTGSATGAYTAPRFRPDLTGLKVYPNPFKYSEHTEVIFEGLTEEVNIRIFTLSGELVREVELSGETSWSWDVKNEKGENVARGIYVYLVTNPAGEKVTGKLAVIKEKVE